MIVRMFKTVQTSNGAILLFLFQFFHKFSVRFARSLSRRLRRNGLTSIRDPVLIPNDHPLYLIHPAVRACTPYVLVATARSVHELGNRLFHRS